MAKSKGKSPTARSLERLRAEGFIAEVVEKTIPRCFIKKDFIGCIDIIAFRAARPVMLCGTTQTEFTEPYPEIVGIQATSGSNHAARRTKALAIPELKLWLQAGGHFEVWSWTKPKTGRKWELRRERITPLTDAEFAYNLPHAQGCDPSVSPCHCDQRDVK